MPATELRVAIVDDEPLAREHLRSLLEEAGDIQIVGECRDGREALELIRELNPDLVFLDVQMPELSGLQVIRELGDTDLPFIIFVTAFDKYALKAFEIHALDYLLKPFSDERFHSALNRAREQMKLKRRTGLRQEMVELMNTYNKLVEIEQAESKSGDKIGVVGHLTRIPVKTGGKIRFIETEQIIWIEALDYYAQIHCAGSKHIIRDSLKALEDQLDQKKFVRIHRGAIANLDFILELKPLPGGDYEVILTDRTRLKLSRRRKEDMEKILGRSF